VNRGVYLEFALKGLSSVGRETTDTLLQNSIPGYLPPAQ